MSIWINEYLFIVVKKYWIYHSKPSTLDIIINQKKKINISNLKNTTSVTFRIFPRFFLQSTDIFFFSLSTKNSIIIMAELKYKRNTIWLNKKCAEAKYLLHKVLNLQKPICPRTCALQASHSIITFFLST
jgi:hypothetical protein